MGYIIIGLVSAFNMLIIKIKLEKKRYEDAIFDACLMALLAVLFAGSFGGMVVAMVSSFCVSLYLLVSPPDFFNSSTEGVKKFIKETQEMNKTEIDKAKYKSLDI